MRFIGLVLSVALYLAPRGLQAQSFLGASSVASNSDDRLEIFAIGADGACWHAWQGTPGGAWTSYVSLGGSLVGTPSAIINFDGRLEVFAL